MYGKKFSIKYFKMKPPWGEYVVYSKVVDLDEAYL